MQGNNVVNMGCIRSCLYLVFSLVFIVGCSSTPDYPEHWPQKAAIENLGCSDLTGSYENYGVWSDGDRILLADIFFPLGANEQLIKNYELSAVSHVTLDHQNDKTIVVKAWVGKEFFKERSFSADQFTCQDGFIVLHDSSWQASGIAPFVPIVYHSAFDRLLFLASDGSLVIENHEFSKGAVIIFPVAVKARYWFKFPRILIDYSELENAMTMPQGVRDITTKTNRLLPPVDAKEWSGYGEAKACLEWASQNNQALGPDEMSLLNGQATQSFVLQDGRGGVLVPSGNVEKNNWIPATHDLRIEKQHWLQPTITDRYVICLLRRGYYWEEH